MWKIKHIFDGDYGCEETQNENPKVSVTIINENNEEKYVTAEDEWLREKGLDVGDEWVEYE